MSDDEKKPLLGGSDDPSCKTQLTNFWNNRVREDWLGNAKTRKQIGDAFAVMAVALLTVLASFCEKRLNEDGFLRKWWWLIVECIAASTSTASRETVKFIMERIHDYSLPSKQKLVGHAMRIPEALTATGGTALAATAIHVAFANLKNVEDLELLELVLTKIATTVITGLCMFITAKILLKIAEKTIKERNQIVANALSANYQLLTETTLHERPSFSASLRRAAVKPLAQSRLLWAETMILTVQGSISDSDDDSSDDESNPYADVAQRRPLRRQSTELSVNSTYSR